MTQLIINVGSSANDGQGDPIRTAFIKTNENFSELFATGGITGIANGSSNISIPLANGNVVISSGNVANVLNITQTGAIVTGLATITGSVQGGNIRTAGTVSSTGNVIGGNITTTGAVSAVGTVQGGNISTAGSVTGSSIIGAIVSASGNIVANNLNAVGMSLSGNVLSAINSVANITTSAYVAASFFSGNGSGLTGIVATGNVGAATQLTNGSTVLNIPAAGGNIIGNIGGVTDLFEFSQVGLRATGNITGGNVLTGGLISSTGTITGSSYLGTVVSASGNVTGGNVLTGGLISSTGTITGSSLLGSVVSASGNVTGGNVLTGGLISATGTITGSSHLGTVVSVLGNVTGGNVLTGGLISSTGTITGGNLITGGTASITGDITGGNVLLGGSASATGNIQGGNFTTSGKIIASSNITGGNILTGGLISATGTATAGNLNTGGNVSVSGFLSVAGNIYANTIVSPQTLTIIDPLVYFNADAPYPYSYDIGFYSAFVGGAGNTYQHTGLTRSYVTNSWNLFSNVPEPAGSSIDLTNAIYDAIRIGNLTSLNINATGTISATGNVTGANVTTAGSLTVNSIAGVTAIVNGAGNAVGNIGSASTYFKQVFAQATTALYADLAEVYEGDDDYTTGTVVSFGGSKEVTQSQTVNDARVAGVISEKPSYLMNNGLTAKHRAVVALTGRVPTLVVGTVAKGDMMVSAGNGHAQACATPAMGTVIGKALQDFNGSSGIIEIVVGRM